MTLEKGIAFIDKLILNTKEDLIIWKRANRKYLDDMYDPAKSFVATIGGITVDLSCIKNLPLETGLRIVVQYDINLPKANLYYSDNSDFMQRLIRLFNLVYERFPNLDKAIEEFLLS